jgi:hypothetical protein
MNIPRPAQQHGQCAEIINIAAQIGIKMYLQKFTFKARPKIQE